MSATVKSMTLFDGFASNEWCGAAFSPCRQYRYSLWRRWDRDLACAMFIGLNPSKADERDNDMTISKCVGFAQRWNCGGIYMLNLYGFCATDPQLMFLSDEPVGPGNDEAFGYCRSLAGIYVACWGSVETRVRPRIQWQSRIAQVQTLIAGPVMCLGRTQDGSPRHPSRLAYDTPLDKFWAPSATGVAP